MSKGIQNPGEGFMSKISETAVKPEDMKSIGYVLDALDEYTWIRGQGPIWLTGSAVNDPEYNDIDIVVERGAMEYGEDDFNTDHDHEAIYDMLVDSESYDMDENQEPLEGLIESENLDLNTMYRFEIPVNRYEFEFDGTEFDINFCHSPPQDGGIELTPFYGQNKTY